jgi:hypothetical protein
VFETPELAVFNIALVSAVMVLVIGMMYLGGGLEAIRQQVLKLALLACGLLIIVFAVPLVERAVGGLGVGLVILVLSGILLAARILMRRRESPAAAERRREALRQPAVRALFVAWFAFIIIATVLLLILTTRSGS